MNTLRPLSVPLSAPRPVLILLPLLLALGASALRGADAKPAPPPTGNEGSTRRAVRNVGVDEFDKLRADQKNTVLDVRTADEFAKGHIPGAVNLDYNSPTFQKQVAELDRNKTYLVHCAGGVRSSKACTVMDKLEFKHLVNLEPGFRAWEKAGKPVDKK